MGFLKWLFGPRKVDVHIHGTVNLNCENLQLNSSIEQKATQTQGPGLDTKMDHSSDVELEPEIGDIQIPDVEFGEDVET